MINRDTFIGIAGAAVLVAAMVGVFIYESANAPAALGETAEPPMGLPLGLEAGTPMRECSFVEIYVRVPASVLEGLVPGHFDVVADDDGNAETALGGASCGHSEVENETGPASFGFFTVTVRPVDDLFRKDGVDQYLFNLEHSLVDDAYGRLHERMRENFTWVDAIEPTVEPTGVHLFVKAEGGAHHLMAPLGPTIPSATPLVEDFTVRVVAPAEGGFSVWDGTVTFGPAAGQALGTYETREGTTAREILGASGQGVTAYASGLAFPDAVASFLPHPRE